MLIAIALIACVQVQETGLPQAELWNSGSACGPNALYCLLRIYDREVNYSTLLSKMNPPKEGNSLEEIKTESISHGLQVRVVKTNRSGFDGLKKPFIAHLENQGLFHYVIVVGHQSKKVRIWEPNLNKEEELDEVKFFKTWSGYALEPVPSVDVGITVFYLSAALLLISIGFLIRNSMRR